MKKIYKTDIGSLCFIGFGTLIFLFFAIISFFTFGGAPLSIKVTTTIATLFGIMFFLAMINYSLVLTEDSILIKTHFLFFLDKYSSIKFEEIGEVFDTFSLFPEMQIIFLRPRHNTNKVLPIMIGFGLPWSALLDLLGRLPKDVKINFGPDLWKRINNPLVTNRVTRINTITLIIIILTIIWFIYWLWKNRIIQTIRALN